MLLGDLFSIRSIQKQENAAKAILAVNSGHPIFEGHFPDQPVLPGACQLQMVKEVLQSILNAEIQIIKASQVKFLSVIDPNKIDVLTLDIKHSINDALELGVTASITNGSVTCFKFSGTFRVHLRDGA